MGGEVLLDSIIGLIAANTDLTLDLEAKSLRDKLNVIISNN